MPDSTRQEGQDYIRTTTPTPGPITITEYIRGEFSHQFTAREHNTYAAQILERHNIDESITSGWSDV